MDVTKEIEELKDKDRKREQETIEVFVGGFGQVTQRVEVAKGTTQEDIAASAGLTGMEIHVNRQRKPKGYVVQQGDVIVGTPEAVVGGTPAK